MAKKAPGALTPAPPKRRTKGPLSAAAAGSRGAKSGVGSRPTPEEIAQAAYHRYLSRGGADGRDFDDWIEAERELIDRRSR